MNLRIFDTADDLVHAAARAVVQRVTSAQGPIAIGLSGGSTPKPLYELLGRDESLRAFEITWVLVDERYVPLTDPRSNAAMIQATLFANGLAPKHQFLPFRTDLGETHITVRRFEEEWRSLGLTTLDTILLGVGDDGHTASLFPGTMALQVEEGIATDVWVEKLDMWRVTLTKPVIRAAAQRIVLAAGASKAPVIRELRAGNTEYPIAQATNGVETWWFVDRAAVPA